MKTIKNHPRPFRLWPAAACVLGAGLLAGCAPLLGDRPTSRPADAEDKKTMVVSLLGDVFHASYIGASIFSKRLYDSGIPEWEIDEYAESIVSGLIRRSGRYRVSELSPKRGAFAKVYKQVSRWKPQADNYDLKKIAPLLTVLHEKYGIEVLVLVLSRKAKDPTDKGSNLMLSGYGLYHNDWPGVHTFTHLFARLLVVDTQNAALIDEEDLSDFTQVGNKLWHNGLAQTPPEQREVLRQEVRVLVKRNLIKGLVELGFASLDELRSARREVLAGSTYREAVKDLYRIFNMRRLLASYTRAFVSGKLAYDADGGIYADVYRRWMQTYFKQAQVIPVLQETYQSQGYTLDELKSVAVLAENERTRREISSRRLVQAPARLVWRQLATPARLDGLLRAIKKRQDLLRREAARAL